MKKAISTVLAGAMIASMALTGSVSVAASEGTDLSIMWWGSDARHEATLAVLDMYTEATGVTFTSEYTGWDGYWQKLPVLAASNSMTDVLQMDAAYIQQYIDNGQLADLTDLIDVSDLLSEEEISNLLIDGKLYGVPLSRNGGGLVYDKTLLEECGIDLPTNGWTYDEMVEWARAAKDKLPEGVYPLPDLRWRYNEYQEYAQSNGAEKTLNGNTFNFDTEMFIEFNEFYAGLVEEGLCPPSDVTLSYVELDPVNDYFVNGTVAMRPVSVGSVASLASMLGDHEIGCVSYAQGEGGAGWAQSTVFFSVGANSENIEAAVEFIKYFISDVEAGQTLKTVRGLPLSDEVYEGFADQLDSYGLKSKELYDTITAEGVNFVPYWDDCPSAFSSWSTEFTAQEQALVLGETTPEDAAEYLNELGIEAAEMAAEE